MKQFMDDNGFFFYTNYNESNKMRAIPSRAGLMALADEVIDQRYHEQQEAIADEKILLTRVGS